MDADFWSLNVQASLVILIGIGIFANMAIAVAFILLARTLLRPAKETVVFRGRDRLEEQLMDFDLNIDEQNSYIHHETTPVAMLTNKGAHYR
jgi:hypothetical protein